MKTLFYLPIVLFLLLSCSKSDTPDSSVPSIVGKWKQIEVLGQNADYSNLIWHKTPDGYTIEFLNNGKFISSKISECSTGSYVVSSANEITMTFNCSNFANKYVEKIETLTDSQLIINPTYMQCDEGCSSKFEKIK